MSPLPAKGPEKSAVISQVRKKVLQKARKIPTRLMHSFNANSDLLISAPSSLVCLSAELDTAPRSLPARSMRENLPGIKRQVQVGAILNISLPCSGRRFVSVLSRIWKTAWLREELELADVLPEVRRLFPRLIRASTSSTEATSVSVNPTTTT